MRRRFTALMQVIPSQLKAESKNKNAQMNEAHEITSLIKQLHQRPNRRGPRNGREIPGHRRAQNGAKEGF